MPTYHFFFRNASIIINGNTIGITIPANVDLGSFTFNYSIVDINNNISTYSQTYVLLSSPLSSTNASASGKEGLTFTTVDMGTTSGSATLNYNTHYVPDRIDIYQGTIWLTGTGTNPNSLVPPVVDCSQNPLPIGFVGKKSTLNFNYDASKGSITIVVSGCVGSSTLWDWNISCPK